ncbi:hypothetical protein [Streptomyces sp. NBC_00005]|uniref:hypothetical protein n=1 Tax=Streptomyces sp. NBC_00005 TaxID=2903609 RepID=UPI002F91338C
MTTTHLTRLRTRMLATAYSNADFWARRWAFLTDQAVGALARRDPATADALAASLLAPEFLHDTRILGAAVEAGIDSSTWPERRVKIQAYARDAHQLSLRFDPDTEAQRIWASLYEHYRPIAAALAVYLRDLPPTWQEDLFTPSPDSLAHHQTDPERPGPETAPYDALDWEDCPACAEAQDQCRYHRGLFAGMEYQRALIKTVVTDHQAIDHLQQRHHELETSAAQTPAADANAPATEQKVTR